MTDYTVKRFHAYKRDELLSMLRDFAKQKQATYISAERFCDWSRVSQGTIERHFGSWRQFCKDAGLEPRYNRTTDKKSLLDNLGRVWEKLGRQPRAKEMKQPLSPISNSRYRKQFGTWYGACLEFLAWKTGQTSQAILEETKSALTHPPVNPRKGREVSLTLRYTILKRDGFRCVKCGRSPATKPGVQLHIDHVQPWTKGGVTGQENLQTLCEECNLGKSNTQ